MVRICLSIRIKGGAFYGTKTQKKNNLSIIVARINKIGNNVNARPCYNCLLMMKAVGIRKVYYTVDDDLICEKVNNMVSIHVSAGTRTINMKNTKYSDYYEKILKDYFPNIIKKYNLELFIKYNFNNVLPNYRLKIEKSYLYIYNPKNICIINARIL